MGLLDKAKGLIGKNADKVEGAIDKAADVADDKTGGKYADQIDAGSDKASKGGFGQDIFARAGEMDARFVWIFFAIVLLALLPELWRAANFVLRGLLNYQLLVLVRVLGCVLHVVF